MREIILNFPKQLAIGIKAAENIRVDGVFDNLVICGVGGSALPGDLLLDITDLNVPPFIHRDYGLPETANEKSLIICISFSGNTEETLSAYEEALSKNYKPIAICTGGKLEQLAKSYGNPVAVVPNDCLQPRFGTGYLVSALIKILENCHLASNLSQKVLEAANSLKPEIFESQGKILAEKLIDKVPVVYASSQYKSVCKIWKIKFNENSKVMAFWNFFPELNHNEMVGLTNLKANFHFIILKDQEENERNIKRMDLFNQLAKEKGANVDFVDMPGNTKIEKILNSLLLGDWASYYLALSYGQDPVPVEIVEKFKKQL